MEHQQQPGWRMANVAPTVGLIGLKHEAVARFQLVGLARDPVLDLALQAEHKFLAQMDDGIGPGTSARLERDQKGLHALTRQPFSQVLHLDLIQMENPGNAGRLEGLVEHTGNLDISFAYSNNIVYNGSTPGRQRTLAGTMPIHPRRQK